jgi:hypothetical protein
MAYLLTRRRSIVTIGGGVAAAMLGCHGKGRPGEGRPGASPLASAPGGSARVLQTIDSMAAIDGDGATVQRVFPSPSLRHLDPFVLLDDFDVREPAGFPMHPHRGFEAFTYMIEGAFHHEDTMGNDSTVTAGGTQRFTSGRGARHSEMPGPGATNRGLQLWVNLPRRLKTIAPEYAATHDDGMPVDEVDHHRIRTIVGDASPVSLRTDVEYADVELLADASYSRTVGPGRNTLLYVIEGEVRLGDTRLRRGQGALLGAGDLTVDGTTRARFAYLSGRPHDEPILHRGPFVD